MFHSFCIIDSNIESREKFVNEQLRVLKIAQFDCLRLSEPTITIAQVREIKKFLSRKPLASAYKAVVINADNLTLEAQQALLKTLEEPDINSVIYLSSVNENSLLPTIISRTQIIKLKQVDVINQTKDAKTIRQFWQSCLALPLGARFQKTSEVAPDKISALSWITVQISFMRSEILQFYQQKNQSNMSILSILRILNQLIATYNLLEKNISLKLAMDHLFLAI